MYYLDSIYTLTLKNVPGISTATLQKILSNLESKPSSLEELYEVTNSFIRLNKTELEKAFKLAEQTLIDCERSNIKVIGIGELEFPQQLREIPNPPTVLYVKGEISCLKPERSVAVIGTRYPSDYGRKSGEKIAQIFAEQGLIVVSGLAVGCDTAAHEGCLKVKGHTIAVLAHGLHTIYPAENKTLAYRIIDLGGCLVSEYPLGRKTFKNQFVERNRIQSGLSSAIVVIESDIKGGTMHTAKFCLEQGRPLVCLNHPLKYHSEKSRGNQKLISEKKRCLYWMKRDCKALLVVLLVKILNKLLLVILVNLT